MKRGGFCEYRINNGVAGAAEHVERVVLSAKRINDYVPNEIS